MSTSSSSLNNNSKREPRPSTGMGGNHNTSVVPLGQKRSTSKSSSVVPLGARKISSSSMSSSSPNNNNISNTNRTTTQPAPMISLGSTAGGGAGRRTASTSSYLSHHSQQSSSSTTPPLHPTTISSFHHNTNNIIAHHNDQNQNNNNNNLAINISAASYTSQGTTSSSLISNTSPNRGMTKLQPMANINNNNTVQPPSALRLSEQLNLNLSDDGSPWGTTLNSPSAAANGNTSGGSVVSSSNNRNSNNNNNHGGSIPRTNSTPKSIKSDEQHHDHDDHHNQKRQEKNHHKTNNNNGSLISPILSPTPNASTSSHPHHQQNNNNTLFSGSSSPNPLNLSGGISNPGQRLFNLNNRVGSASVTNLLRRDNNNNNTDTRRSSANASPNGDDKNELSGSGGIGGRTRRSGGGSGSNSRGGGVAGTALVSLREVYQVDLTDVIGEGAFGTVCKGISKHTGEVVAIKNLNKQKVGTRNLMACLGEVETMTLLNHEYIVRLLDVFQDEMTMFIVMEFVGHGPLTDYVTKNGPLPESTVKRLSTSLLLALEHMHAKGIVHRDLKPANCLISSVDYRPSENMMTAVANRRSRGWSLLRKNKAVLAVQAFTSAVSAAGGGKESENNNNNDTLLQSPSPRESVTMYNNNNSLSGSPRAQSPSRSPAGMPPLHQHQQQQNHATQNQLPSWFTNNNNNNNNNNNRSASSSPRELDMTHPAPLQNSSFCSLQSAGERSNNSTSTSAANNNNNNNNNNNTSQQQQHGDPILGVKICDLGMAIMVGSSSCLTNYAGTPSYMAPEITLAERIKTPYGKPVDMWSLGVMIYWLGCARMPFSKRALHECTVEALTPTFEEPEWSRFSKEAKEFISTLLTFDQNKRVTAKVALKDRWITSAYELSEADSKREAWIEQLAEKADREGEDAAYREIEEATKVKTRKISTMKAAVAIVIAAHRLIFFSSVKRLVRHGCSNELISAVNRGLMSFFLGGDYDPPSHAIRARRLLRRPLTPPPKKITAATVTPTSRTLSPPTASKTTDDHHHQSSSSSPISGTGGGLSNHACDFVCTLLENAPRVTHFDVADNGIESIDTVQRIVRAAQGHRGLVELSLAENPLHPLAGRTLLRFARNAVSPSLTKVDIHGCANLPGDIGPQLSVAIKERIEQLRTNPQKVLSVMSPSTEDLTHPIGGGSGSGNLGGGVGVGQGGGDSMNSGTNSTSSIRIRKRSATTTTSNNSNSNNRLMSAGMNGRNSTLSPSSMDQQNDTPSGAPNTSTSHSRQSNTKAEWSLEYSIMRHLRAANPSRGIFAETISSANRRSASSGGSISFSTSYQLPPLQRAATPSLSASTSSQAPQHNVNEPRTRANTTLPPSSSSSSSLLPPRSNNTINNQSSPNLHHPTTTNSSNGPNTSSPTTRNLLHTHHNNRNTSSPASNNINRPATGSIKQ